MVRWCFCCAVFMFVVVSFVWWCFCGGVMVCLGLCFCGFGGVIVVAFLRFRDCVYIYSYVF